MTYGYIVGRERASLSYFEGRLRDAVNPQEREELGNVVRNVKRALEVKGSVTPPVPSWSQALSSGNRRAR